MKLPLGRKHGSDHKVITADTVVVYIPLDEKEDKLARGSISIGHLEEEPSDIMAVMR